MKIVVTGHATVQPADLTGLALPPAWRKATRNMVLASVASERALGSLREKIAGMNEEIGLLVSTRSGELETSAEFMKTWAESKLARPVLFQNSLHNATAGFISIEFQLRGPAFTSSTASEDSLILAKSLLENGLCSVCLVVAVEVHKKMADLIGETWLGEGAVAVVLMSDEKARALGLSALATLGDVKPAPVENEELESALLDVREDALFRWSRDLGAPA